jgi:uncharacterized protein DUF541
MTLPLRYLSHGGGAIRLKRMRHFTFMLALTLCALVGCSGRANGPQFRANVSESLTLKLTSAHIPALIQAIERDSAFDDPGISINVSPAAGQRSATGVEVSAYALALADARAKAQAIATRLGVRLGAVLSVAEFARSGMGYQSAASPPRENGIMVQAPGNGAVVLAVSYAGGSGPISVFGIDPATTQRQPLDDATGIVLTFTARGATLAAAAGRMRAIEAASRNVARAYGASVTLSRADFNTY